MESANLHHQHQLQDQFVGSSSLSTPSFFALGTNNSWNSNLLLNSSRLNHNVNGVLSSSKDLRQNNDILVPPSLNTSMVQDLGFHWASNHLNHANIKEELPESSNKFSDTISDPSNSEDYTSYNKHDLSEKVFLKSFSSSCQVDVGALYSNPQVPTFQTYSQIFPSANISNLNSSSSPYLTSSGMNLEVLDLLNSAKFGGGFGQPAHNNLGIYKVNPVFGLDHMQESSHWLTNSPNKIPSFMNGMTDTKRSSPSETKVSHTPTKKARFESRSSLTPFKVRKEKLGDRIAALQQLVAPFGKTDTASVLMEAIGYIKFLQDQVETLSVPYMKSSRNNTRRSIQEGSNEEGKQETKPDLRSRGLCLVPLSTMSYITSDNLGWSGPNYGGGRI